MGNVARQVSVTGRVQGVFFRAWTRDHAQRLGISGWVRNCSDGSVEAHIEGEPGAVARMIALLHDGPPHAAVKDVEVEKADPSGMPVFEIRH